MELFDSFQEWLKVAGRNQLFILKGSEKVHCLHCQIYQVSSYCKLGKRCNNVNSAFESFENRTKVKTLDTLIYNKGHFNWRIVNEC